MNDKRISLMNEIILWVITLLGIFLGVAIAAMAAGFIFGVFVKFAKLAFFFVGV